MLSDWESDLTELSSSEDEYVPGASKKKARAKPKDEYKVCASTFSTRGVAEQFGLVAGFERAQTLPHYNIHRAEPVRCVAQVHECRTPGDDDNIVDQIIDNVIELNPEYQRGVRLCHTYT